MLNKIINTVKNNKYSFFIFALILLIFIGSLISDYVNSLNIPKENEISLPNSISPPESEEIKKTSELLPVRIVAPSYGGDIFQIEDNFVAPANILPVVLSAIFYTKDEVSTYFGNVEILTSGDRMYKFTLPVEPDDFVFSYNSLLNNSVRNTDLRFSLKKLTERPLNLQEDEFLTLPDSLNQSTGYKEISYGIYLNDSLVGTPYGDSSIVLIHDIVAKSVQVNTFGFFPKELSVINTINYENRNYVFKPYTSFDPNFQTIVSATGVSLNQDKLDFSNGFFDYVYVINKQASSIVPYPAKYGRIKDFIYNSILDNTYVLISY